MISKNISGVFTEKVKIGYSNIFVDVKTSVTGLRSLLIIVEN